MILFFVKNKNYHYITDPLILKNLLYDESPQRIQRFFNADYSRPYAGTTGLDQKGRSEHNPAMTLLQNQKREKPARLAILLSTNPVNLKDAEEIADEIGQIDAAILKQQIRHDQELRSLLTPDQQIIFDSLQKPFLIGKNRLYRLRSYETDTKIRAGLFK